MLAVMDRDRRLTGYLRGQVDQPTAPPGFELSNGWRVSYTKFDASVAARDVPLTRSLTGREAHHVNISKDIQRRAMARCAQTFSFSYSRNDTEHIRIPNFCTPGQE